MRNLLTIQSIFLLLILSCNSQLVESFVYNQPEDLKDGISVGTLKDANIDSALIIKAVNEINRGKYNEVHSLLIFKDNKLVFEEYFPGHRYKWDGANHHGEWVNWNKLTPHHIMSATKSISSTCIGIAIEKGYIDSIQQPISDYLPQYKHLLTNVKDEITIEHLLTMTSGLEWDEWGAPLSSSSNDLVGLWINCDDPVKCILERNLIYKPGLSYTYSGGNMVLIGEIIKSASNLNIDEFSKKYIFEPLGVNHSDWSQKFENDVIYAGGGVIITPRDMVKFGVTFLNNGIWNGNQIISKQWVEECKSAYRNNNSIIIPGQSSGKHSYSYSWWLKSYQIANKQINMYNAGGWGGQAIMVMPELNTVVVFTGGNYKSNVKVFDILEEFIIPAMKIKHK